MNEEVGRIIEKVEVVLEKFNGQPEDKDLAERLVIVDGEMVRHEIWEQGELVSVTTPEEGGTDGFN